MAVSTGTFHPARRQIRNGETGFLRAFAPSSGRRSNLWKSLKLAVGFSFLALPALAGTQRYVSTRGADSGTCTNSASPCKTITYAYSQVSPGDTVNVAPGTYTDYYAPGYGIYLNKSGTASAPIYLVSTVPGGAIIDGGKNKTRNYDMYIDHSYNVVIGFVFQNAYSTGIFFAGASHITFQNVEIRNGGMQAGLDGRPNGFSAIYEDPYSSHNTFDKLYSHDNGTTGSSLGGHGIYLTGSYDAVTNSVFYHNYGNGIQLESYGAITGTAVVNNTSYDNGFSGIELYGYSKGYSFTNVYVLNNISMNNGWNKSSSSGISVCSVTAGGGIYVENNDTLGNSAHGVYTVGCEGTTIPPTLSANFTSNPSFVGPGSGGVHDFRLQSGSIALRAGQPISWLTVDYDGTARPNPPSVGAFQSSTSAQLPPPPQLSPSASGTTIPSATRIVDPTGGVWTVDGNGLCYRNGVRAGTCANVQTLLLDQGSIYAGTASYGWWMWTGSNWNQVAGDPRSATSPNGLTIPSATQIVDSTRGIWTVDGNGICYRNGVQAGTCANVKTLLLYQGSIYAGTASYGWWLWTGSNWNQVAKDPRA
jgi:hypothetical protein